MFDHLLCGLVRRQLEDMSKKEPQPYWPAVMRGRWDRNPGLACAHGEFAVWGKWTLDAASGADYLLNFLARQSGLVSHDPGEMQIGDFGADRDSVGPADPVIPVISFNGPIVLEERADRLSPLFVELAIGNVLERASRAKSLLIRVNSIGGNTTAAMLIANMLEDLNIRIRLEIHGACHSAAALYLLPIAETVAMRAHSTLMIHEPTWHFVGRASDMMRAARQQRKHDESEWRAFSISMGVPFKMVRRLALRERYLKPSEALRLGLINDII
ncbi:MAG: ATP-dependent Clp protease proteolytic subunit [Pontixanthobacter sp.]